MDKPAMLRIVSLNLNGIRSATTKGVWSWLGTQSPDVLAVQELKAQAADLDDAMRAPEVFGGRRVTFITR
jgi:exodeoxyribonuclease-3